MRIAFFGTTEFAATILRAVIAAGHDLVAVVTQPDRPAGRGLRLRESPVKQVAAALGLPLAAPVDPNAPDFLRTAATWGAELFAVAAYGRIFRRDLLALPPAGCVNVHASLLPRYRGAAPIHHALINGDAETGITTIWMDERMDAGDMILQRALPIAPDDDVATLEGKLAILGGEVLGETLRRVAGGDAPRVPQDHAQATLAPAITRACAQIDWCVGAAEVCNLVRGLTPTPGAYTYHRGRRLKVLRAQVAQKPMTTAGTAGEIVETTGDGLLVRVRVGAVWLTQLQAEGGRPMSAAEYARGHRPQPGEMLGNAAEK